MLVTEFLEPAQLLDFAVMKYSSRWNQMRELSVKTEREIQSANCLKPELTASFFSVKGHMVKF